MVEVVTVSPKSVACSGVASHSVKMLVLFFLMHKKSVSHVTPAGEKPEAMKTTASQAQSQQAMSMRLSNIMIHAVPCSRFAAEDLMCTSGVKTGAYQRMPFVRGKCGTPHKCWRPQPRRNSRNEVWCRRPKKLIDEVRYTEHAACRSRQYGRASFPSFRLTSCVD